MANIVIMFFLFQFTQQFRDFLVAAEDSGWRFAQNLACRGLMRFYFLRWLGALNAW